MSNRNFGHTVLEAMTFKKRADLVADENPPVWFIDSCVLTFWKGEFSVCSLLYMGGHPFMGHPLPKTHLLISSCWN
jgi:hypothetical protein